MREKVLQFLQREIDEQHIPGAVIHIAHRDEVLLQESVGYRSIYPEKTLMKVDTVFDIASLTKVVATLPAVLHLLEQGELRLDDPVHTFLPDFKGGGKESITIQHLLTHTSGLPAHRPYFQDRLHTDQVMKSIYQEKLAAPIGEKVIYSDLGFITLYKVVESITRVPFHKFIHETILEPLGMKETMYLPNFPRERYAPTEYLDHLKDFKHGIVHDDNTEFMGGVSGHAGLFSTVKDLAKFCRMIEKNGLHEGTSFLSKASLDLAKQNFTPKDENEYRGLGWIMKGPQKSSCGDLFAIGSYGHTGFTGTSIWFDPEAQLHVILLTNRVHLGRKDPIIRLRPRLHNIIRAQL